MIGFLFAPLVTWISLPVKRIPALPGYIFGITLAGLTLLFALSFFAQPFQEVQYSVKWITLASYDVALDFRLDFYSWLMLILVALVGTFVGVFSFSYIKKQEQRRFYNFLALFMTAMFVLLAADNLLLLLFGWEMVGFSSWLLIGFWYRKPAAARASRKAFLINRIGDLALIAVLALIWNRHHDLNITSLAANEIPKSAWVSILIFLAAGAKSAQLIFMTWLPDAMEGPTPVSALIHAATMVAAGVYLLFRLNFLITFEVGLIILCIGVITSLYAALIAFRQFDLKRILAYSTISQLGFMVMGVATLRPEAGMLHLLTHGFFKAGLFLTAGILIHKAGVNDIRTIRLGSWRSPVNLSFLVMSIALIGFPFTSGFLSKEAIFSSLISIQQIQPALGLIVILGAFMAVFLTGLYMGRAWKIMVSNGRAGYTRDTQIVVISLLAILSIFWVVGPNPFHVDSSWIFYNKEFIGLPHLPLWMVILSYTIPLAGSITGYLIAKMKSPVWVASVAEHQGFMEHPFRYLLYHPGRFLSFILAKIEMGITRLLDALGVTWVIMSNTMKLVEKYILDGTTFFAGWVVQITGVVVSRTQKVSVQGFLLWSMFVILLLLVWMIV